MEAVQLAQEDDWDRQMVLIAFLLAAAWTDGRFAPEEQDELDALAIRTRTLHGLDPVEFAKRVRRIQVMYNQLGERDMLRRAFNRFEGSESLAVSIYSHCADLVLVDRVLTASETAYLDKIGRALGVPQKLRAEILNTLKRKNFA